MAGIQSTAQILAFTGGTAAYANQANNQAAQHLNSDKKPISAVSNYFANGGPGYTNESRGKMLHLEIKIAGIFKQLQEALNNNNSDAANELVNTLRPLLDSNPHLDKLTTKYPDVAKSLTETYGLSLAIQNKLSPVPANSKGNNLDQPQHRPSAIPGFKP